MKKQQKIIFLRISYWLGAIVGTMLGIRALFFPKIWGLSFGIYCFTPGVRQRLDLSLLGAALISLALLLIWADHKPMERKGVLWAGVFPLMCAFMTITFIDVLVQSSPLFSLLPLLVFEISYTLLIIYNYIITHNKEHFFSR